MTTCTSPATGALTTMWYVEEEVCGVTPDDPVLKPLRFTGGIPQLSADAIQSAELDGSREILTQRRQSKQVNGDINYELSALSQDDLYEAILMGTWGGATVESSVDVAVDAVAKTFTRGAGDFTTNVAVGDLVKFPQLTGRNAEPVVVTAVTALVVTAASAIDLADEASTSTNVNTNDVLTVGSTKRSFSVFVQIKNAEDGAAGVGSGEVHAYKGVNFHAGTLNFAVNSAVTGTTSLIGKIYEPDTTFPSGSTFAPPVSSEFYTGTDGAVLKDGVVERFVTSMDFTFDNGANAEFELGSDSVANVSKGRSNNSFSGSAGYYNANNVKAFVNETDLNVLMMASHEGNAFAVEYPTAKLTEAPIPVDGEGTIVSTFSGQALGSPSVKLRRI